MNKFFVDSNIWIEFFKGKNKTINEFIIPLIDEDRIFYNGIILSELLIGATNEKGITFLQSNFTGFNYIEADKTTFEEAGRIGFKLRWEGITVPLTNLIIAVHCISHNLTLITRDEHFKLINEKLKLKLHFFKQKTENS